VNWLCIFWSCLSFNLWFCNESLIFCFTFSTTCDFNWDFILEPSLFWFRIWSRTLFLMSDLILKVCSIAFYSSLMSSNWWFRSWFLSFSIFIISSILLTCPWSYG
jgi:hypothetical protein